MQITLIQSPSHNGVWKQQEVHEIMHKLKGSNAIYYKWQVKYITLLANSGVSLILAQVLFNIFQESMEENCYISSVVAEKLLFRFLKFTMIFLKFSSAKVKGESGIFFYICYFKKFINI